MHYVAFRWTTIILLSAVTGDILFTNGFMLLRVPPVGVGVPVNQVALAFGLAAILFSRQSMRGFTSTFAFMPLALMWAHASLQLTFGVFRGGMWAIRDAANVMETGFLFLGYCLASDPRFFRIFLPWFRGVFSFAAIYLLFYPVQDIFQRFSPMISSLSGYNAPLFFSFGNPSSVATTAACFQIVSHKKFGLIPMLLTGALVMTLIVFVQARIVYLQLAFLLLLIGTLRPTALNSLGSMFFMAATLMTLFLLSGIELPGRLGHTFTLEFLLNHLEAVWGGGDDSVSAAAAGVDLRLNWWFAIHEDLQKTLPSWLFGLGYGVPLTSFRGPSDDIVREPHNSFVSVYGRLGIVGIIAFLAMHASVLSATLRLILNARRMGEQKLQAVSITILCFLGVHLIYSTAEGGLEVSFIAVPYYFFAGVCIAQDRLLTAYRGTLRLQPGLGTGTVQPPRGGPGEMSVHSGPSWS